MAFEVHFQHSTGGPALYFFLRNAEGQIWSPLANSFVEWDNSSWSSFALPLAQQGYSRFYAGNMPSVSGGVYSLSFFEQVDVASDPADLCLGFQQLSFDGAVLGLNSRASSADLAALAELLGGLLADLAALLEDLQARLPAALVDGKIDARLEDLPESFLLDRPDAIETDITLRQALRLLLAVLAGRISGADGNTVVIRDVNNTRDRVTAQVDAFGNRTVVAVDPH